LVAHWEALVTFQQMIVLCNADGMLDMTTDALSKRTGIPLKIIKKGISILESPDPGSRTPGHEGRRIERIDEHRDWGWHLINHATYRSLRDQDTVREQTRERVRRHREKRAQEQPFECDVTPVTPCNAPKRHADADADTKKQGAVALPDWIPAEAWDGWLEVRKKSRAPNTSRALRLAIAELARLKAAGQDVRAVLEQSTLRGWRGVFEVKGSVEKPGGIYDRKGVM
jgi:hypothetical protein